MLHQMIMNKKYVLWRISILGVLMILVWGSHLACAKNAQEAIVSVTEPSSEDHGTWLYGTWDYIKNLSFGTKKISTVVEIPENYQKLDLVVEPGEKPARLHINLNGSQDVYSVSSAVTYLGSSLYESANGACQTVWSFLYRVYGWTVGGITPLVALVRTSIDKFRTASQYLTAGLEFVFTNMFDVLYRTCSAVACIFGTVIGSVAGFLHMFALKAGNVLYWIKDGCVLLFINTYIGLKNVLTEILQLSTAYFKAFAQYTYWELLYEVLTLPQTVANLAARASVPFLAGLGLTLFTWLILYSDSQIPGQFPPTPVSPRKFKKISGHAYHSGYVFAVANGILVFIVLLWLQPSIA